MGTAEFQLTDRDFARVQAMAKAQTGICLPPSKRPLVYGRLARRLRALGLGDFSTYCDRVERDIEGELGNFVNALTTNLTSFFREAHHFDYLAQEVVPVARQRGKPLRIWSAGCSTGEEPWSIAITVHEASGRPPGVLLASDIDTRVLAEAAAGVYALERLDGIEEAQRRRWFQRGVGSRDGLARVRPALHREVHFRVVNLMRPLPMRERFDVVFCRNVLIYFDKPTQSALLDRFADVIEPNGLLFVGHSESLASVTSRFDLVGQTVYRRCAG